SFRKLDPRLQIKNPVMFVVEVVSVLVTVLWIQAVRGHGEAPAGFILWVTIWLWFTLLFANFAEALAECRGKAQAEELRKTRGETSAKRLAFPKFESTWDLVRSSSLKKGDAVLIEAGAPIPAGRGHPPGFGPVRR